MARTVAPGSFLNEIFGSSERWPGYQILVYNPRAVTINQVAAGVPPEPPLDITDFVTGFDYEHNVGYENGNDPNVPAVTFTFKRDANPGRNIRRGLIEDGVIVQVKEGDVRVRKEDWLVTFTGTFRGRPGDDPGTRAGETEGLEATAYGREERYLNQVITTEAFPQDVDAGAVAYEVARQHMGLGQDEILFGDQGYKIAHAVTQLVEIPALQALWELMFVVGKKPKFDSLGRLTTTDSRLDKAPARIYSAGNACVRSIVATPNDVEVNNSVALKGLAAVLSKVPTEPKLLTEFEVVTGFFDSSYDEAVYYSQDHSARAQDTYLVTRKRILFSGADWREVDEFHGKVSIDTRYLRNARVTIFVTYLATQIAVATLDLLMQSGVSGNTPIPTPQGISTIAIWRNILYVLSIVALAGLVWSMNFIGRGKYEVWGTEFEYAYRELVSRHQLMGLAPEDVREAEYVNHLLFDMEKLDQRAFEQLRREMVKNQLYTIQLVDDPILEVDDIIEMENGDRYYIVTVQKSVRPRQPAELILTCWKVEDGTTREIDALNLV